jgi:hypothetical protein
MMDISNQRKEKAMFTFETINKPRGALVRGATNDLRCVRVFRNSPEDLILQIWNDKRYMLVALHPAEAHRIALALIKEAEGISAYGENGENS